MVAEPDVETKRLTNCVDLSIWNKVFKFDPSTVQKEGENKHKSPKTVIN